MAAEKKTTTGCARTGSGRIKDGIQTNNDYSTSKRNPQCYLERHGWGYKRLHYQMRVRMYEADKRKLQNQVMAPEDYELEIIRIARKWNI